MGKNKGVIGLEYLEWAKITGTDSDTGKPTYDTARTLGTAVKAELSVTTNSMRVYGDNALQISADEFKEGTLNTETNYSDLETEAALYGHKYTPGTSGAPGEIEKNASDVAPSGGVGYITEMLKQVDGVKSRLFRAVFLPVVTANLGTYTESVQTRGESLNFLTNAVSFVVGTDDDGVWNDKKDFEISSTVTRAQALAAAKAYIAAKRGEDDGSAPDNPEND